MSNSKNRENIEKSVIDCLMKQKEAEQKEKESRIIYQNKGTSNLDEILGLAVLFDRGYTFGIGKQIGGTFQGAANALVGTIGDLITQKEVDSFVEKYKKGYHSVVHSAKKAANSFSKNHPLTALGTETAGIIVNPMNKLTGNYVASGHGLPSMMRRGGIVGIGEGVLSTFGDMENKDDISQHLFNNVSQSGSIGFALPAVLRPAEQIAESGIRKLNQFKPTLSQLKQNYQKMNEYVSQNADKEIIDFSTPNLLGRKNLIRELNSSEPKDVPFGEVYPKTLSDINQIRSKLGESELIPEIYIPANVVKKWQRNRLTEKYSPDLVAEIADDIFHYPGMYANQGGYPHIQAIVNPHTKPYRTGFISQDQTNKKTTLKTVYQFNPLDHKPYTKNIDLSDQNMVKPLWLGAHLHPASLQGNNLAGRALLSDLQRNFPLSHIPYEKAVVNTDLPHITQIMSRMPVEQQNLLQKAVDLTMQQVPDKAGTLGMIYSLKKNLNRFPQRNISAKGMAQQFDPILNQAGLKPFRESIYKTERAIEHPFIYGGEGLRNVMRAGQKAVLPNTVPYWLQMYSE